MIGLTVYDPFDSDHPTPFPMFRACIGDNNRNTPFSTWENPWAIGAIGIRFCLRKIWHLMSREWNECAYCHIPSNIRNDAVFVPIRDRSNRWDTSFSTPQPYQIYSIYSHIILFLV